MTLVDAVRDADTIIHGDFHPGNLMLHNGELLGSLDGVWEA